MENIENKPNGDFTKDNKGLLLTVSDAEEYYAYKKQKKIAEIVDALSRTEGIIEEMGDAQREIERALRIRQTAVRMNPSIFAQRRGDLLRKKVAADCVIGGNGETLARVKAYEMKLLRKMGAKELTVVLTPSLIDACRYHEIRKELKLYRRAAKKCTWKVWVGGHYPYTTLIKVARLVAEMGAQYFSVPYFAGCDQLRFELYRGCQLEIVGVNHFADFKKMAGAGIGRIVTGCGYEWYTQWMQEVEKIRYAPQKVERVQEKTTEQPQERPEEVSTEKEDTTSRQDLPETELKFV